MRRITWKEAVWEALQRMTGRHRSDVITRSSLLEEELQNIVNAVEAKGSTPDQTLSRILQELRDDGKLHFEDKGIYRIIDSSTRSVTKKQSAQSDHQAPVRKAYFQERIIRDSETVTKLKILYDFKCQMCGMRINTPKGPYIEGHHIMPLGGVHRGPDTPNNILIVCPNQHVMLDYGAVRIDIEALKILKHRIDEEFIAYHNTRILDAV